MSFFHFLWLRRLIRRKTNRIPEDSARIWKQRLSIAYALIAWNGFGIVCYMVYNGKSDWASYHGFKSEMEQRLTPAQQWSRTLGIGDAKVIRFSGVKKVKEFDIHNEFEESEEVSDENKNDIKNSA